MLPQPSKLKKRVRVPCPAPSFSVINCALWRPVPFNSFLRKPSGTRRETARAKSCGTPRDANATGVESLRACAPIQNQIKRQSSTSFLAQKVEQTREIIWYPHVTYATLAAHTSKLWAFQMVPCLRRFPSQIGKRERSDSQSLSGHRESQTTVAISRSRATRRKRSSLETSRPRLRPC